MNTTRNNIRGTQSDIMLHVFSVKNSPAACMKSESAIFAMSIRDKGSLKTDRKKSPPASYSG